jgi:hypothetical protein
MSDADDDRLRRESQEIEHLLDDIRSLVTGPAWQRIERVLSRVVRLHGAGLAHVLAHARASGATAAFDERIAADDLLASLLLVHNLHPLPPEDRVRRAVDLVRRELGLATDQLALVAIADGRVELRATGSLGGGAMAARVAEAAITKAIVSAAPEIATVDIRSTVPLPDPSLVQLRVRREVP